MNEMLSIMAQNECRALLIKEGYNIVEPIRGAGVSGIWGEEGMPILETEVGFKETFDQSKNHIKFQKLNFVELWDQYRRKKGK